MTITPTWVPTSELGLEQAVDGDDTADYLVTALANSLKILDALFNNVSGHTHGGVHQGGPISAIPVTAIPDGSITSAKITDGTIATVDLSPGCVTTPILADGAVTGAKIASGITLTSVTLNSPTLNSATSNSPTITGTVSGGPTFNSGPSTTDWFRCNTSGQGLYNSVTNSGVGFDSGGPFVYGAYGGGHLITEAAAQTLSNKTISGGQINSAAIANPTLQGTVSGTPAWGSAQSFPAGTTIGGQRGITTHSSTDWIVDCGSVFFSSIPNGTGTQIATNFNGTYSAAPYVVCQLQDSSGGTGNLQKFGLEARGIGTSGFFCAVDNETGSTQTVWVDWIAFGH